MQSEVMGSYLAKCARTGGVRYQNSSPVQTQTHPVRSGNSFVTVNHRSHSFITFIPLFFLYVSACECVIPQKNVEMQQLRYFLIRYVLYNGDSTNNTYLKFILNHHHRADCSRLLLCVISRQTNRKYAPAQTHWNTFRAHNG